MKWLHFILAHSIFIAICAVSLCYQTILLLQINISFNFYFFIFFSTLSCYNFYWLLSVYSFTKNSFLELIKKYVSNFIVLIISTIGLLFSMVYIKNIALYILGGIFLTLIYTLPIIYLKQIKLYANFGIFKTILLAFTWAYVTVLIPYFYSNIILKFAKITLLFNNRFLFMLMLCIIFDARDTLVDKFNNIHTITTQIHPKNIKLIMLIIFIVYLINGILFRLLYNEPLQIISILLTGIAVGIVYFFSLKKQNYYFYYVLVDGLMLFSTCTTIILNYFY